MNSRSSSDMEGNGVEKRGVAGGQLKRWTVPKCCSFVRDDENAYGNAVRNGRWIDGELVLERRRCVGAWRCRGIVSLKEDEVGASDGERGKGVPEFGVVDGEGLELELRLGDVRTCVMVSTKAEGYPSKNCRIW